jgi:tetratricopeptide (TPR) repeat protein
MSQIRHYSLFVSAVLTLAAGTAVAQQIQGDVRHVGSQQPVLRAFVRCSGTGGISDQFTDRSGKFYFRVSPGHYDVTVHLPGYKEEQQSVDLLDTRSSEYMFFRLSPESSATNSLHSPSTIDASVPSEAQKEFDKGEAALAIATKGSMEKGVRHLEMAVSIYPPFLQANLRLGTAYMDLQQWDKAEQALRKALEIDPRVANAMFALGEIYLRQKKDEEAEKILLQGLQVESRSYQGHLTLGRVYWDMGSKLKDEVQSKPFLEKAYDQAKRALTLNPNLAGAHLLKGNLLLRAHRVEDALKEFEEYLRIEHNGQFAGQTRVIVKKIKKALVEQRP